LSAIKRGAPTLGLTAFAVICLMSPLALLLPSQWNLDWTRLSYIGQSYTGPAALLSAAALAGVVLTVRAQGKQIRVTQLHAVRSLQFELSLFAMQNPDLLGLYGLSTETEEQLQAARRRLFRIALMRHLQLSYLVGDVAKAEILLIMEHEFFADDAGVRWWREVEPFWRAQAVTRDDHDFLDLVVRAVMEAELRLSTAQSETEPVSGRRTPARPASAPPP
jgi:hypothetical protein